METEIAAYNRQAIALKLVPETAELANGRDFRLRSGFNSDIVSDFENNVKVEFVLSLFCLCSNVEILFNFFVHIVQCA